MLWEIVLSLCSLCLFNLTSSFQAIVSCPNVGERETCAHPFLWQHWPISQRAEPVLLSSCGGVKCQSRLETVGLFVDKGWKHQDSLMSRGQTLVCSGDWLRESLLRQSCRAKESMKSGHSSWRNPKGTGAGCPLRPKVEPEGKRRPAWLNRELCLELSRKKEKIMTFGRRGRPLRKTTSLMWGYARGVLKGPKPS